MGYTKVSDCPELNQDQTGTFDQLFSFILGVTKAQHYGMNVYVRSLISRPKPKL